MLVIREQQMEAFSKAALGVFEQHLLEHIQEFFPRQWRQSGAESMRNLIRLGLDLAQPYGLSSQREIFLYVSLMLYLGSYFDTDPLVPWAEELLLDRDEPDPFARISATYDCTLDYLDDVAGEDDRHLMSAYRRFVAALGDDRLDLAAMMELGNPAWLFPERYSATPSGARDKLADQAGRLAAAAGLPAPRGNSLYLALIYLFGHRFPEDPQHAWVTAVLDNRNNDEPDPRFRSLCEAAVQHVRGLIEEGH